MNKLNTYISELLYRYECVIVPGFGGFVTNETSSQENLFNKTFSPPKKVIGFNKFLINNDGLLANYISSVNGVTYEKALREIYQTVDLWNEQLNNNSLTLEGIGDLYINNNNKIIFEPIKDVNYLTDAFGLETVKVEFDKKQEPVVTKKEIITNNIWKYVSVAAVGTIMFVLGNLKYISNTVESYNLSLEESSEESIIQEASIVPSNVLPIKYTIEDEIFVKEEEKKEIVEKIAQYHVIINAFRKKVNASKEISRLNKKGGDSKVARVNRWGLSEVSYKSFTTMKEAGIELRKARVSLNKSAWILKY